MSCSLKALDPRVRAAATHISAGDSDSGSQPSAGHGERSMESPRGDGWQGGSEGQVTPSRT